MGIGHIVGLIVAVIIAHIVVGPKEFGQLGLSLNKGAQETWRIIIEARNRNLNYEDDSLPPAA